jgi:hypothetical protein
LLLNNMKYVNIFVKLSCFPDLNIPFLTSVPAGTAVLPPVVPTSTCPSVLSPAQAVRNAVRSQI